MSTLKVSNIQATGETASRAVSGVAAAWVNFDCSTASTRDSINVASLTDTAEGRFSVNFSSSMDNDDYAFSGSACSTGFNTTIIFCMPEQVSKFLTSSIAITAGYTNPNSNAAVDYEGIGVTIHGDLA